jgi:hypothetical protein
VVVTAVPEQAAVLMAAARDAGVPAGEIGRTGGDRIRLSVDGVVAVDRSVEACERAWSMAIERRMERVLA